MQIPARLLDRTASVFRPSRSAPDAQGGVTITYPLHGTIRCRRWPASAAERTAAGKLDGILTDNLVTDPGADVQRNDRIVENNVSYTVLFVSDPSVREHHRKCLLQRHQEGA